MTLFPGLEKDLLKGSSFDAIILTIHFVWQSCILRRCDSGSLRGSSRRSWNPLAAHGAEGPILDITHAGQYGQSFKQWAFFQRAGKQWTIPWANFHCSFGVFKTLASFPICQSIFPAQTKGFRCTIGQARACETAMTSIPYRCDRASTTSSKWARKKSKSFRVKAFVFVSNETRLCSFHACVRIQRIRCL